MYPRTVRFSPDSDQIAALQKPTLRALAVKTPKSNLQIEISSRLRHFEKQKR
jgi:restriction endonuclease S subunit